MAASRNPASERGGASREGGGGGEDSANLREGRRGLVERGDASSGDGGAGDQDWGDASAGVENRGGAAGIFGSALAGESEGAMHVDSHREQTGARHSQRMPKKKQREEMN
jgi:hypothetical protein